jgi:hypothetical protein
MSGSGLIVGIAHIGGEKGDMSRYTSEWIGRGAHDTLIFNSSSYRIEKLSSAYNPGDGGWMLSGADPTALVKDGNIPPNKPWTVNAGPEQRSMMGYTSTHAPVIVSTIRGTLTYKQSAEIMLNIGCYGAIRLDGGNSTAMSERNAGISKESGSPIPLMGKRRIPNVIVIK